MVSTGAAIRKLVSASDSFIGSFHWTKPIGSMFSFLKNALTRGGTVADGVASNLPTATPASSDTSTAEAAFVLKW